MSRVAGQPLEGSAQAIGYFAVEVDVVWISTDCGLLHFFGLDAQESATASELCLAGREVIGTAEVGYDF